MSAYYNEIDPFAAEWLRRLIAAGHIAAGDVDERSIADVKADDLKGYVQCHFFAGIGVWSYALRRAGWPDDRHVWTGSCPCQPFSAAGKGEGAADPRHLWPEWFRFIRERRPVAIFGEQVSAAIRHDWLDLVSADLEGLDYAVGAAVLGAHSVGAPHIRQRLYFVADANGSRRGEGRAGEARDGGGSPRVESSGLRIACELADADGRDASAEGLQRGVEHGQQQEDGLALGDTHDAGPQGRGVSGADRERDGGSELAARQAGAADAGRMGNAARTCTARLGEHGGAPEDKGVLSIDSGSSGTSFWSACDWLPCIDGKARPVEPGTFPLAHGVAGRVGRLRAYGNAICAETARSFIEAYLAR